MTLQSSGKISLSDIKTEFEGPINPNLGGYYSVDIGVPSAGRISFSDFYGKASVFIIKEEGGSNSFTDANGNFKELDLRTYLLFRGWNGTSAVEWQINPGIYVWSDNVGVPALNISNFPRGVTITNYGFIMGKGGRGGNNGSAGGQSGGSAINFNSAGSTLFLTNESSGYILGGGGGGAGGGQGAGGGGAGGGRGGTAFATARGTMTGGAGGALGKRGNNSQDGGNGTIAIGGTGGGSGGGQQANKGADSASGGGGGGRAVPATTTSANMPAGKGAESKGGSGGGFTAGGSGSRIYAGDGGGGWGSKGGGGAGGAAGKSINITTGSVVITKGNSRIYGVIA